MRLLKQFLSLLLVFAFVATCAVSQAVDSATVEAADTETVDASTNEVPLQASEEGMPSSLQDDETTKSADEDTVESKPETSEEQKPQEEQQQEQQQQEQQQEQPKVESPPVQAGPLIDLLGPTLLSLEMIDENSAKITEQYTSDALRGKKVIGLYFSADWCGPCRQFTPELVNFYKKMNSRRGRKDQFEIVWVSRCRTVDSFGQYFTHMNWVALPPEEAMGARGQMLGDKYKVKGIPTLVLLDDLGHVITTDARNKIPQDKAGIGFPWRSPVSLIFSTIFPRSLRLMVKSQVDSLKTKLIQKMKSAVGMGPKPTTV